jgi:hypothetical protein
MINIHESNTLRYMKDTVVRANKHLPKFMTLLLFYYSPVFLSLLA